jgi:hypothetical protein
MIETNAKSHGLDVGKAMATCLQHVEGTALSYYYLFYFIFEGIFGNEPYVNITPQLIIEKLIDSGKLVTHPGAAVTDSFVNKIKTQYYTEVMNSRVEILYELAKVEYDRSNISKYAIITLAKDNKIHYFLNYDKERIIRTIRNLCKSITQI